MRTRTSRPATGPVSPLDGPAAAAVPRQVLHTHLGRLPVSVREGRAGAAGGRTWVAQLHSDLPEVEAVGDVVAATEREALAGLALAVRRYGGAPRGPVRRGGACPPAAVGGRQLTGHPAGPLLPAP